MILKRWLIVCGLLVGFCPPWGTTSIFAQDDVAPMSKADSLGVSKKHLSWGQRYYKAGQFEDAEAQLLKAWDHNPTRGTITRYLARTYNKTENYEEAIKWYRLAAEQGYALAQTNIGLMYEVGEGVNQNYEEAIKWYHLAAEQGFSGAQSKLGLMYESGKGVMQNYEKAVQLYRQSAEQGNLLGQKYLGVMHVLGQGVKKDYNIAYMWFFLSGSKGNKNSLKSMLKIETEMTSEQIKIAQEMARNWKPTKK